MEFDVAVKSRTVFQNLGWDVGMEEKIEGYNYRFDLILRRNDKVYGFVEVVDRDNLTAKAKEIQNILATFIKEYKPLVFVITNGFSYDIYHLGEFYGSLSVPPTPDDVDLLFGGAEE